MTTSMPSMRTILSLADSRRPAATRRLTVAWPRALRGAAASRVAGAGRLRRAAARAARPPTIDRVPPVAGEPAGQDREGVAPRRRRALSGFRLMPMGVLLAGRAHRARASARRARSTSSTTRSTTTRRATCCCATCATPRCAACACGCSSTTCTRPAAIRCSSASRRSPTSRCGSSIRSAAAATACCRKYTYVARSTSGASTTACTTSCSSPTARSSSPAGATSPTSTSCAA